MASASNAGISPNRSLYCDTCRVRFSGPASASQHYSSTNHRKKQDVLEAMSGVPKDNAAQQRDNFCSVCNVLCNTTTSMEDHRLSPGHRRMEEVVRNPFGRNLFGFDDLDVKDVSVVPSGMEQKPCTRDNKFRISADSRSNVAGTEWTLGSAAADLNIVPPIANPWLETTASSNAPSCLADTHNSVQVSSSSVLTMPPLNFGSSTRTNGSSIGSAFSGINDEKAKLEYEFDNFSCTGRCKACDVDLTSRSMAKEHLSGRKHSRARDLWLLRNECAARTEQRREQNTNVQSATGDINQALSVPAVSPYIKSFGSARISNGILILPNTCNASSEVCRKDASVAPLTVSKNFVQNSLESVSMSDRLLLSEGLQDRINNSLDRILDEPRPATKSATLPDIISNPEHQSDHMNDLFNGPAVRAVQKNLFSSAAGLTGESNDRESALAVSRVVDSASDQQSASLSAALSATPKTASLSRDKTIWYQCTVCMRKLNSKKQLDVHQQLVHGIVQECKGSPSENISSLGRETDDSINRSDRPNSEVCDVDSVLKFSAQSNQYKLEKFVDAWKIVDANDGSLALLNSEMKEQGENHLGSSRTSCNATLGSGEVADANSLEISILTDTALLNIADNPLASASNAKKPEESHLSLTCSSSSCTHHCTLCDMHVNSARVLESHVSGAKHLKKLGAIERGEPIIHSPSRKQFPYRCDLCAIQVNTLRDLKFHNSGQPHLSKLAKTTPRTLCDLPPVVKSLGETVGSEELDLDELTKSTPREYQKEVFMKAMASDTICFLPTGTGKTLISVMVMSYMLTLNPARPVLFLVDKILLALQQSDVIKREIGHKIFARWNSETKSVENRPLRIALLCGEKQDTSGVHLVHHDVIVVTAAYYLNLLEKNSVSWTDNSLIIMDEVHHCVKEHPYSKVLRVSKHSQLSITARPKFLGLTASPAGMSTVPSTVSMLQRLLDVFGPDTRLATVVTNMKELQDYRSNTAIDVVLIDHASPGAELKDELSRYLLTCYLRLAEELTNGKSAIQADAVTTCDTNESSQLMQLQSGMFKNLKLELHQDGSIFAGNQHEQNLCDDGNQSGDQSSKYGFSKPIQGGRNIDKMYNFPKELDGICMDNMESFIDRFHGDILSGLLHSLDQVKVLRIDGCDKTRVYFLTSHLSSLCQAMQSLEALDVAEAYRTLIRLTKGTDMGRFELAAEMGLPCKALCKLVADYNDSNLVVDIGHAKPSEMNSDSDNDESEEGADKGTEERIEKDLEPVFKWLCSILHDTYDLYNTMHPVDNSTNPLRALQSDQRPLSLILVRRRKTAKSLTKHLRLALNAQNLGVVCIMGHGGSTRDQNGGLSVAAQKRIMSETRAGTHQVLVATSVAEEGVDMPLCQLVVLLDPPDCVRALVQIRGRARCKGSHFVVVCRTESQRETFESLLKSEEHMIAAVNQILTD